ncbi:THAP domain-containing protein 5-like [Epinephelus fuscoguttatus]|uniref:THAP domain-containing protein 5-like n=1 Tax=Epinephelus fuscoguttatus TaxID=293821 RepID=UPI0020D15D45|nr:THAP domain-containing protein 5-like [Epinephelus fuscoguttatus]
MACCSTNYTSRPSKKSVLQVFRFPLDDPDRLDQWTLNTRRQNWTPNKTSRLCSEHFESHQFSTDSRKKTPFFIQYLTKRILKESYNASINVIFTPQ